ncbi:hypothetical protein EGW07_09130 [Citrobacter amalonaticus]|nr:hypothetical protein EGW07_09130 [Citrobacter amalonaticus]
MLQKSVGLCQLADCEASRKAKACWMSGLAGYRRIGGKPVFPGEAQRCGGLIPGGVSCWKEKTPARCLV